MGTAAPVIITVYPRNDGVLSRRLMAAIRVPSIFQQSPPTPTDGAVKIEDRPGMTVYALYVLQPARKDALSFSLLFDSVRPLLPTGSLGASRGRASSGPRRRG